MSKRADTRRRHIGAETIAIESLDAIGHSDCPNLASITANSFLLRSHPRNDSSC